MDPNPPSNPHAARFATTHWSVVVAAGQSSAPQAREALATLCEGYWYPLYAYIRRRGYPSDEAQDLTQEFFALLLEDNVLHVADRRRGRFRSFLLTAFNHFLAKHWRRLKAQKRGGGRLPLALDFEQGAHRYESEPSHDLTPQRVYERRWALGLLEQVLADLEQEYVGQGKGDLFTALKGVLGGDLAESYPEVGRRLGLSEGAVKVAVHRLRQRFGKALRARIARTVADPAEVDEEIAHLMRVVGG